MTKDIDGFNPRVIPQTQAKNDVLELTKSPVELYIESTVNNFDEHGENCEDYYQGYKRYAASNGFGVLNMNNFSKEAKKYITKKRVQIDGERSNRYFLKEDFKQRVMNDDKVDINFDTVNV